MSNTAKAASAVKPCICSAFTNLSTGEHTGCTANTKGLFAPGHDAKLKGLLINAGIKDQMISDGISGELTSAQVSGRFGFYSKVMEGIKNGKAKQVAKANRKATRELAATTPKTFDEVVDADVAKRQAKAAKMNADAPKAEAKPTVTAKVGRWTYTGTLTDSPAVGPQFTYTDKKGVSQTTTKFSQV
jgi:hypothetical protein